MLLKNLIKKTPNNLKNLKIKGLALNSSDVKKDYIFFALKGTKLNGENFINEAIKKGVKIVICSNKCKIRSNRVNIIRVKNTRETLNDIASKFYRFKPKNIIAVTGTNGKTSVAEFYYQILNLNQIPVASIGTLGIKHNNQSIKTSLTSPDVITIHKNLEKLKKKGIDNVILEASSHGLSQRRLNNIKINTGIFTNFSQDHLDYHKTMNSYLNSKLVLFSKLLSKKSNVVTDKTIKEFSKIKKICKKRKLKLLNISKCMNEIEKIKLPLKGKFQKKNLSMAILAARLSKLSRKKIFKSLKKIKSVDGRLDLVKTFPNNVKVFVDYAHTPDALIQVISTIKKDFGSNISLVFGCGGERDFKKRPLMAKVAKSQCNKIYVTDDNPIRENPTKIRKEITKHLKGRNFFEIGNRSDAIKKAIINAEPNEIILIAGKGHESNQDYGNKIIKISDKQIVKKLNLRKRFLNRKKINLFFNSKVLSKILKKRRNYYFERVVIDSRDVKKNDLFIAIKGKKKDGNEFISKALEKGANFIVSSKSFKRNKNKLIKVKNSLKFLNDLAKQKRRNSKANILSITGSAGKTTLKNMLKILLQKFGDTYSSPRSFNNHFGVPISLSNLNQNHKYGIFEIGMSKAGEINNLSKMVKPNLAVITNVAEAHIENFKNLNGVAKAKGEIIDNVSKGGTVILNRDNKFFNYFKIKAKNNNLNIISFGRSKKSNIYLVKVKKQKDFKLLTIRVINKIFKIKVKDINIYNVLASLAVLKTLNLNYEKIRNVYKIFKPSEGRGKTHNIKRYKKRFKLIDESYNANPHSMKIAIESFSEVKKLKFKKYFIMGDMLELGKKSKIYHKYISKLINSSDIDKVFVKGEKSLFTYKYLKKEKRGNICQTNEDIDLVLKNIIKNNDYLMIKGSNATGLNIVSKAMIKGI